MRVFIVGWNAAAGHQHASSLDQNELTHNTTLRKFRKRFQEPESMANIFSSYRKFVGVSLLILSIWSACTEP